MKALLLALILVSTAAWAIPAVYTGEYVDGMHKICLYTSGKGDVAITIPITKMCPMRIEV